MTSVASSQRPSETSGSATLIARNVPVESGPGHNPAALAMPARATSRGPLVLAHALQHVGFVDGRMQQRP